MGLQISNLLNKICDYEQEYKYMAYVYALLGHFFILLTWTLFKSLSQQGFDYNQILYFRGLIVFILNFIVISKFKHEMYPKNKSAQNTLIARFFIQMASPILQFYAISQLYVSDASVLALTNPIWVQISSYFIYREPIKKENLIYTLTSFIGIIFICRPQFIFSDNLESKDLDKKETNHFLGCLAMLMGAILLAISQSLFKGLQGKTQNTVAMQYFYLSNLISTPFGLINQENTDIRVYLEPKYAIIVILIAVLAFLGQNFQSRSLFMESPSKLSPLSYTRMIYALLIDIFIFKIDVNPLSMVGFTLIIFSLIKIISQN